MKVYKTKREIELRLNELDKMESQIVFSADFLTNEDKKTLGEIRAEKIQLSERLRNFEEESIHNG